MKFLNSDSEGSPVAATERGSDEEMLRSAQHHRCRLLVTGGQLAWRCANSN